VVVDAYVFYGLPAIVPVTSNVAPTTLPVRVNAMPLSVPVTVRLSPDCVTDTMTASVEPAPLSNIPAYEPENGLILVPVMEPLFARKPHAAGML